MPKMPNARGPKLTTPLAAARLKPVIVDRWSSRYRLKTLAPAEVTPEIAGWLTDPAVMEGLNAPSLAMGLDAFRAYVASFDNLRRSLLCIRARDDDRPLGLMMLEVDLRHKIGSLHLVVGKAEHRNLAVAVEATAIMVRHFFDERRMEKLTFQPLARNRAAVAACTMARLTHEGTLRSHRIDGRTGERLDQMVFGMTRAEYDGRFRADAEAGHLPPYDGPGFVPGRRRT